MSVAEHRMQTSITELDKMVATALLDFERVLVSGWRGKENDCVNLFAHECLSKQLHPGGVIKDLTQIGIEVGVPQIKTPGSKAAVRKDLVIWGAPREVAWDEAWEPVRIPRSIIEWKVRRKKRGGDILDSKDINWLTEYSEKHHEFVGYAVTVDFTASEPHITSARIQNGKVWEEFHRQLKAEPSLES